MRANLDSTKFGHGFSESHQIFQKNMKQILIINL